MPQMNPISWVTLFLLFISIFILTNSINYFYPNKYSFLSNNKNTNLKLTNWKW